MDHRRREVGIKTSMMLSLAIGQRFPGCDIHDADKARYVGWRKFHGYHRYPRLRIDP